MEQEASSKTTLPAQPSQTDSQPPTQSTAPSTQSVDKPAASQATQITVPETQSQTSTSRVKGQQTAETPAKENEDGNQNAATGTSTRRNANGSVSSVYSGNRIRYLKKEDGQPFWRRDIQFLFLRYVFEDETRAFTKVSTGSKDHTFAEIYIDAMAKSSKCSQVLKDKLMSDHSSAVDMAMICLLVNVGRMNTTLNFFPEMRARVRTYHAIPCLQARQGAHAYKQLQDGPRLKSILKGATEDTPQPSIIEDIIKQPKPRTNPVNLIFVFSQFAPKISEVHFQPPRDFFDLFMRTNLSSKSRARAFLWLIWWYLESDLTSEDALNNPFGPGEVSSTDPLAVKVPSLDLLSDEQAEAENVDTEEELAYGEAKRKEREAITANDSPAAPSSAPRRSKAAGGSFLESQHKYRLNSPNDSDSEAGNMSPRHYDANGNPIRGNGLDSQTTPASASRRGQGRGGSSRRAKDVPIEPASSHPPLYPAPSPGHSSLHLYPSRSTPNGAAQSPPVGGYSATFDPHNPSAGMDLAGAGQGDGQRRKIRSHVTVEQQRRQRVDILLYEEAKRIQSLRRKQRRMRGEVLDAWIKVMQLPDDWDSEEDELHRMGGLDDLNQYSKPITSSDNTTFDTATDLGDIGDRAKHVAQAARRVSKNHDGAAIRKPARMRTSRRGVFPGGDESLVKDGGTPLLTGSATMVHTARMAIDDPRRKRPYKPRAKRNVDMQPQTSKLDLTPLGSAKRKGGRTVKSSGSGGRGGKGTQSAGATRPGESVQSTNDFLSAGTPGGDGDAEDKSEVEGSRADGEEQSVLGHDADGDVDMRRRAGGGDDEDEDDDEDGSDGDTEDMDGGSLRSSDDDVDVDGEEAGESEADEGDVGDEDVDMDDEPRPYQ